MTTNDFERKYAEREEYIAEEIKLIIRQATSHHFFSTRKGSSGSEPLDRLKIDLMGTFFTSVNVRLGTFFQKGGANSLQDFIVLAKNLGKIDAKKEGELMNKIDALLSTPDSKYLKSIRDKVVAHWDLDRPEHPNNPISMNPLIEGIISIFAEAGGRAIAEGALQEDVLKGWKALLEKAKASKSS